MTIACKQQPLNALRHWSRICGLSGILAFALAWFVFCIKPLQLPTKWGFIWTTIDLRAVNASASTKDVA